MTLEEHIADEKERVVALTREAKKNNDNAYIMNLYAEGATEHQEKADLLEELKVLRRAYELACDELGAFSCMGELASHNCDSDCSTHWKAYFIQKAREENDTKRTV